MGNQKLNIAVIISSSIDSGGGYQYEYMVLNLLKKYHNNEDISLHYYAPSKKVLNEYSSLNLDIRILKENIFQKIHRLSLENVFIRSFLSKLRINYSFIEKKLLKDKIDLIYFLSPDLKSHGLTNIPFIFTLWDLGHLDIMEFPEVSYEGRFELREFIYSKSLKKAIKVIVDSDYGKQNAIKRYSLDERRVEVLRYLPNIKISQSSQRIDIKKKYNLKNDFIFYPAQFWAHKNHIFILKAIQILREKKSFDIDVIFSGFDKGNLKYILQKAEEFGVDDLIHYIGFAPNDEISFLYKQSLALVMPTYLGPTNIPPLEAFSYETPVCYSDTPFFREQVGDAVFFMDLRDPNTLVQNILTIQNNSEMVKDKVKQGKIVLESWNEENFYNKLLDIFNGYKNIRNSWE